eukprot:Amastigsp_a676517_114.p1 type:complete len:300 gc:universal Amastigsp_a676517_114:949-50(-)
MASEPHEPSSHVAALKDFTGGWIGGLCRIPIGHPLDTLKVRMQTTTKYRNMFHAFVDLWRTEGIRGLYRGAQSPAIGMAALNASLFVSYGHGKRLAVSLGHTSANEPLTPMEEYFLGMYAGVFCSLAEGPVDFLKCQLQLRASEYRGFLDCARKVYAINGIAGVYQGLVPTMARNVPAYGFFFATYSLATTGLASEAEALSGSLASWKVLTAGGLAGAAFWGITYPIDVVKSSVQADAPEKAKRLYAGTLDAAAKIYAAHGWRGFFKGFTPCITRAMPANAAAWYGYELTQRAFAAAGL